MTASRREARSSRTAGGRVPPWVRFVRSEDGALAVNVLGPSMVRVDGPTARLLEAVRDGSAPATAVPRRVRAALAAVGLWLESGEADSGAALRILDGARRAAHPGPRRVTAFRVVLTERCNLRCSYCFVPSRTRALSGDRLRRALDRMLREVRGGPIEEVQFFGGEPMLAFEELRGAVEYIEARRPELGIERATYSITTNGTVLPRGAVRFLRDHDVRVDVSVDGFEAVNDRARGRGAHARAMRTFAVLRLAGVNVGVIVTPTAANHRGIPEFVRFLCDDVGCANVTINAPQPGRSDWELPGRELARGVLEARRSCEARGVRLSSPADRVTAAFETLTLHDHPCVRRSGDLGLLVDPQGAFRICDVDWSVPSFVVPEGENLGARVAALKTAAPPPFECLQCIAFPGCGGPCPLERELDPGCHLRQRNRCGFYVEVAEHVIREAYAR